MTKPTTLLDTARPLAHEPLPYDVRAAAYAVLEQACDTGGLELEGSWRLSPRAARDLELRYDTSPPGGWSRFVGLMAGTPWMTVGPGRFFTSVTPDKLPGERDVRRALLSSFTEKLVPPTTAGELFVHLGLHPSWGVRLATMLHGTRQRPEEEEMLTACAKGVYLTVSTILQALRPLPSGYSYDLGAFGSLVHTACQKGHSVIKRTSSNPSIFLSHLLGVTPDLTSRIHRFATVELFDGVLLPAGAVTRCDGDRFSVHQVPEDLEIAGFETPPDIFEDGLKRASRNGGDPLWAMPPSA